MGETPTHVDFGEHPERLHDLSVTELFSISRKTVLGLQLAALQKRFSELAGKVTALGRLATEQKIAKIGKLEDGALLLFPHSLYKSYPISVIEKSQFDRLTRWLGGLTSLDLSRVELGDCQTIDDWIDAVDSQTAIRVIHSGGTTGKLSLLPRSEVEIPRSVTGFQRYYEGFADEPDARLVGLEQCPIIIPNYRKGAMGQARLLDGLVKYMYGGDETMVVALNTGRLSADMLSLAGRLRVAQSRGSAGVLQISDKVLARRDVYLREQEAALARRGAFFERLATTYRGQRVILLGHWHQHHEIAKEALAKGIEQVFAPNSLMKVAGGMKGHALPEGFDEVVKKYLGIARIGSGYGMSEATSLTASCALGHFHLQPFLIPYVLEPRTGALLPRTGVQTGRYGFFDLMAETYWGGFLTGDEVTIDWGDERTCACGRVGAYLHPQIRRYTDTEGGDDKITCAGAPEAHDKALSFLSEL